MQISIIIVNWNAGLQLLDCITSIIQYHHDVVLSVVIIDNASTDNSIVQVEKLKNLPFQLQIIANSENRGFAAACNQGAAIANSEFLLFLNPDTRLFENSLITPFTFMKQPINRSIGICGIRLVDEYGNTSTSAAHFLTLRVIAGKTLGLTKLFPYFFPVHLISSTDLHESRIVDQVIGAFFLIRKNVFEQCHGFDERFFVYFEEVDLSLRAKQLGYSSYFLSNATAFHKGGGCSEQVKSARLFFTLRSRIFYAQKHYSLTEFIALICLTVIEFPLRLIQAAIKISWLDIKNTFSAYQQLVSYFIRRS